MAFLLLLLGSAIVWGAAVRQVAHDSTSYDGSVQGASLAEVHSLILEATVGPVVYLDPADGSEQMVTGATAEELWHLAAALATDGPDAALPVLEALEAQYRLGLGPERFAAYGEDGTIVGMSSEDPVPSMEAIPAPRTTDRVQLAGGGAPATVLLVVW